MAVKKKLRKFNTNTSKSKNTKQFSVEVANSDSDSDTDFDNTKTGENIAEMSSENEQNGTHEFEEDGSEENDSDNQENDSDDNDEDLEDESEEDVQDESKEDVQDEGEEDVQDEGEEEDDEGEEEDGDSESNDSDDELEKSNAEMDTENGDQSDNGDELDYVIDYGPRKKRFKPATEDSSTNEIEDQDEFLLKDEDILDDEDEEVLERVEAGKLKYGRTYEEDHNITKEYINREEELKQKFEELHYKGDWIQRLDITCKAAPMAREMQLAVEADKKIQAKKIPPLKNPFRDMSVLKDDFEREVLFQRHAQAAVLVGVPMLQDLNLYTRRNEEYYAEMVKSDKQMHKVRKNLREKLLDRQASEHARKLRKMRKFGKKVQAEVILTKAQKKKELMAKLKEYRQGQRSDLDFLDGPGRSSAADDDEVAPYVRQRRGAPAGRRGGGRGGRRGRGGRAGGEEPRMRAMLVSDGPRTGGRGRSGRGSRGNRAGPTKRKQMRGGNRAYDKTKRSFTR